MKNYRIPIFAAALLLCCMLFSVAAAERYTMIAEGETFLVDLPAAYLPFTPEMGADSPMCKAFASTDASELEAYMKALDCDMCCVHAEKNHQMWISVKDRSLGFKYLPEGTEPSSSDLKSYYDGVAIARGYYSTEIHNGRTYYIFENGISIAENGINYYISTFTGKKEVIVRWESGNGLRTESDIEEIKGIIFSILDNYTKDNGNATEFTDQQSSNTEKPESTVSQQGYYIREVPAILHMTEDDLNIYTPQTSADSLTAGRMSEQDKTYMEYMFMLDYMKVMISYPGVRPDQFIIEIKVKDDKYPQMQSWDESTDEEIASMMGTIFENEITTYSTYKTNTATFTVFKMPFDQEALRYVTLKNGDLIYLHMKRNDGPLTESDYELLKEVADAMEFLNKE